MRNEFLLRALFEEDIILNKDSAYPKISIVTPSYNQGQFLEKAILSVLNQNYPNLEYIIIDGGSVDNSIEIIKKYEKYLSYWVSEQDKGQSDAINKGFVKSHGEIFAWLNSDDSYLPKAFEIVTKYFGQNYDADILYGRCNTINIHDEIMQEMKAMPFNLIDFIYGLFTIPQQSTFFRREAFFKVGMLNIKNHTCMDAELWINIAKNGGRILFIKQFLANFRLHSKSISGSGKYFNQYRKDWNNIQYRTIGGIPNRLDYMKRKLYLFIRHPKNHLRYYLSIALRGRASFP